MCKGCEAVSSKFSKGCRMVSEHATDTTSSNAADTATEAPHQGAGQPRLSHA